MRSLRPFLSWAASLVLSACAAAAAEKIIALPPYLVEEKAGRLPWRYAEVAGWEVLSTCPERLTRVLIANHHRLHALLGELLPPALQFRPSEKEALLFLDSAHQPPTSQEVVAALALTTAEQELLDHVPAPIDDGRLRRRPPPPRYTFLPNLRLWDRDTGMLFAVVRESEFNANRVALTPDYIATLVRQRLPALPPWFVSGVISLAARARFTEDALTLERLDWPAETGAAALRGGAVAHRPLLPLAEFFSGDLAAGDTASGEALPLWQAQAALFVRWGLAGGAAPRRDALWQFAARAAVEPVTEKLFQECFRINFVDAQTQLAAFLPEALRDPLPLRPAQRPRLPDYPLRPATDGEIARIKGDWERLEIPYVKTQFPVLAPKYVEQARRTLRRAYDGGRRDARLLAVIGLCEVDAGNDAAARPFLEEAAALGKTLRPRAGFELARLRFAAWRASGAASGPSLTARQAGEVLTLLLAAREQQPPLVEVYTLLTEVWTACADAPTRAQMTVLEEGVRLFPRRSDLVYGVAELNIRHGFTDDARWLVTLGLTLAPDAAARTRFEALQTRLQTDRRP
ncbi:MAG: hypothetical protein RIQ93_2414 [Verrucomicrobiota bacterium]|jgi:hypothetical protein